VRILSFFIFCFCIQIFITLLRLLNTHLAYLSRRGYVFVDYVARAHPPFPDELPNGVRHMLHIPMNALTSGPTGGGGLGPDADPAAPRAVSFEWWDSVCPPEDVVEVELVETNRELNITEVSTGLERFVRWAEKLRGMDEECVKIVGGMPFDYLCVFSLFFWLLRAFYFILFH